MIDYPPPHPFIGNGKCDDCGRVEQAVTHKAWQTERMMRGGND